MEEKIYDLIGHNENLKQYVIAVSVSPDGIVTLEGEVNTWQEVVDAGHLAASLPEVRNIVNNLKAKDADVAKKDDRAVLSKGSEIGITCKADVVIIGAGISGCGIARELSRYKLKVVVVEKNLDIGEEATKANNGNIHPGHKVKPGTLKAELNVRGNELYTRWAEELGFDLVRCGAINVAYTAEDIKKLEYIDKVSKINGVPGARMLTAAEVKQREPNIQGEPLAGHWAPTMAVVEPYEVAVALAENAIANGAEFILDNTVLDVITQDGSVQGVVTEKGIIEAAYVINCAGVYADDIAEMAGDKFFTIHGRRGSLAIFDKRMSGLFNTTVSAPPKNNNPDSKGGGMSYTPEGNILLGPSAVEVPDKDDKAVEPSDMEYLLQGAFAVSDKILPGDIITLFSGIRPADYKEDFIIGMSKKVGGFVNVAAIQSPGLAAAPAIAEMVAAIIAAHEKKSGRRLERRADFEPVRKPPVKFRKLSHEQQDELIKKNPKYGAIVCRCELVTEGEILDALGSQLTPSTVDAIKRRTRAGMGRCQGGFCQSKVVEILARELGTNWTDIDLKTPGSYILAKRSR